MEIRNEMQDFMIHVPTQIFFGRSAIDHLAESIEKWSPKKRVLATTDRPTRPHRRHTSQQLPQPSRYRQRCHRLLRERSQYPPRFVRRLPSSTRSTRSH